MGPVRGHFEEGLKYSVHEMTRSRSCGKIHENFHFEGIDVHPQQCTLHVTNYKDVRRIFTVRAYPFASPACVPPQN